MWELLCCDECGQVFHRWVLDDRWQARKFSTWMGEAAMREFGARRGADSFASRLQSSVERMAHVLRLEALTRGIRSSAAPRLLDFGCGFGEFVATATHAGFDAYGVDWDAHRLHGAEFRADRLFRDLGELDPETRFHAVTLFEVLEHLVRPRELLHALRERLVPGGILVAEVPDCTGIRGISSRAEYLAVHPLEHVNAFEPASLERFIVREGFDRVETPIAWVTADPWQAAKTVAKRALQPWRRRTQAYFRLAGV